MVMLSLSLLASHRMCPEKLKPATREKVRMARNWGREGGRGGREGGEGGRGGREGGREGGRGGREGGRGGREGGREGERERTRYEQEVDSIVLCKIHVYVLTYTIDP